MTIYLWFFFSLQVNTGFIWKKKITGWIKVLRLADKHLDGWPKWSHLALICEHYCMLSAFPFTRWPFLLLHWSNDARSHQSTSPPPDCFHIFPTSSVKTCNLDHFHWALQLTFQTHTLSWGVCNPAADAKESPPNAPLMLFFLDLCLYLQISNY